MAHGRAGLAAERQRPHGDGDAPLRPDGRRLAGGHGSQREGLLAEGVAVQGDERVAALQDERIHHVAHGLRRWRLSSASQRSLVTVLP